MYADLAQVFTIYNALNVTLLHALSVLTDIFIIRQPLSVSLEEFLGVGMVFGSKLSKNAMIGI